MNIKRNDKVKITAGKDKGKTGKVLQVFPKRELASVEGLNLLVKHIRPRRSGEKGQRIEFPAPMNISNMMVICPKCGVPSRIGHEMIAGTAGKQKKVRICKKCKQAID